MNVRGNAARSRAYILEANVHWHTQMFSGNQTTTPFIFQLP
jgi:hypothetical protein